MSEQAWLFLFFFHGFVLHLKSRLVMGDSSFLLRLRNYEKFFLLFLQERNGLLVGPYEKADKMKLQEDWVDGVPPGFGKELFDSDVERIAPHLEMAAERFPVLAQAPIARVVSGPISYSPDGIPLLGPVPSFPGLWIAAGFSYGITQGGGAGK